VFAGYDPELDRKIAIKVLHRSTTSHDESRLLREAQALARLSHPNVVAVHDVGTAVDAFDGDAEVGTGPAFCGLMALAVDIAGDRAFVTDTCLDAVVLVDLTTGDRSIYSDDDDTFSDGPVGEGPALLSPSRIVIDGPNQRLLVSDGSRRAIMAVSYAPASPGLRSILSDDMDADQGNAAVGTGPALVGPTGLAIDAARARVLVTTTLQQYDVVIAVDLTTGNRSIVSGLTDQVGDGFSLANAGGPIVVDDDLYVGSRSLDVVFRIPLSGAQAGNREVVIAGGDAP
jgi:DNA-binding beta-propeller fold protein YncE